jgi:acyl dehydratase
VDGAITDEGIARLRARIGTAEPHPVPPHYTLPTTDTFRHVAEAYGDGNPLWCDPAYAAGTRWQEPIAPPALVGGDTLVGEDEVTDLDDATRALLKGDPLRGVHAFYAASAREWWAPLRPLRRVARRNALVAVLDKPSEFAGRAVHEWTGQVFREVDGPLLAAQYRLMVRTARTGSTTTSSWPATTTTSSRPSRRSTRPSDPAAPSPAGGRTSRRATRSGRS